MQNKHNKGDLQQLQSLPLEQKELMMENRIREWYEHFDGNVYVVAEHYDKEKDIEYLFILWQNIIVNFYNISTAEALALPYRKKVFLCRIAALSAG